MNGLTRMGRAIAPVLVLWALIGIRLAQAGVDDAVTWRGTYAPTYFAELQDVELANGRAYVFGVGGFGIMDIDEPTVPDLIGRYQPQGHPYVRYYRGAVAPDYGYGGAREDLVHVIDIQTEALPTLKRVLGTAGMSYEGQMLLGDLLYSARHSDGVEVFDVSDPLTAYSLTSVSGFQNAWDFALNGDHLYVADGQGGLATLDVGDPAAPVLLGSAPTSGSAVDVDVAPGLVFVACGSAGVDVFDSTNPAAPQWLGNYDSSGLAITIDATDTRCYVADWDDIEVFEFAAPASPSPVGFEELPIRAMGLAAAGDRIYAADWARFIIYDFGAPSEGDIDLVEERVALPSIPVNSSMDTTVTLRNTGGAPVQVTDIQTFDDQFTVAPPTSFSMAAGEEHPVTITFLRHTAGFSGTFLRVDSLDPDEWQQAIPITADDDPNFLDIGETAPDFVLTDMDGFVHRLSDYLGRVVVLAFFANW